jgi:uncharacterized phosphosugar-binding protein
LAEHAAGAARHSSGKRLADVADLVIDLCTPVGDALVRIPGLESPVGPSTTMAATAIVNLLKVATAERLIQRGQMPSVLTSAQVVGEERSEELFEDAYLDQAERSGPVLRTRKS